MKVNKDPFSNGTEHMRWDERNCERCIKGSRYNEKTESYSKTRCAIQRDIFTRMYSNEPISQRTIEVCQMLDCPYRKEHYPKRPKGDKYKNEPKLFEL